MENAVFRLAALFSSISVGFVEIFVLCKFGTIIECKLWGQIVLLVSLLCGKSMNVELTTWHQHFTGLIKFYRDSLNPNGIYTFVHRINFLLQI